MRSSLHLTNRLTRRRKSASSNVSRAEGNPCKWGIPRISEAPHNPKVAGSNPAPATTTAPNPDLAPSPPSRDTTQEQEPPSAGALRETIIGARRRPKPVPARVALPPHG